MDRFSIAELAKFSGVQAHTIRIWEKRYSALKPGRSKGNTRFYNNGELRRLLNIVTLLQFDYKISELGIMEDAQLYRLVEEHKLRHSDEPEEYFVSQLIAAGLSYDEAHFSNIFAHCLLRFGLEEAWLNVLYPMLDRVGLFWSCDKIGAGNEHFLTNLLNRKLNAATDLLPPPNKEDSKWILCLPENEFHETGLLMAQYMLRKNRKASLYLGANVPLDTINITAKQTGADYLLLFLVQNRDEDETNRYLSLVEKKFPGKTIYVACAPHLPGLKRGKRIVYLHAADDLRKLLSDV